MGRTKIELFAIQIADEAEQMGFKLLAEIDDGNGKGTMAFNTMGIDAEVEKDMLEMLAKLSVCVFTELQHQGRSEAEAFFLINGIIQHAITTADEHMTIRDRWGSETENEK